jgi:hypothetical protein
MKRSSTTVERVVFRSDLRPEISTSSEELAKAIAWADANPAAWAVVLQTRSAAFGKNSSTYIGCARGDGVGPAVDRVAHFAFECQRDDEDFWRWRARFTLAHYHDKGFKGGFFRQWDGQYSRGCCYLDYTPATLEEVIDRFVLWCGDRFLTREVRVDDEKAVRVFTQEEAEKNAPHGLIVAVCPECKHVNMFPVDDAERTCRHCAEKRLAKKKGTKNVGVAVKDTKSVAVKSAKGVKDGAKGTKGALSLRKKALAPPHKAKPRAR